jgi:hypothetical protein
MKCNPAIPECDLVNYLRSVTANLFKAGGANTLVSASVVLHTGQPMVAA